MFSFLMLSYTQPEPTFHLDSDSVILFIMLVGIGIFMAILFLQSGLDKVFDWRGNLEWLTGHFAKSPLSSMVKLLLLTLAITEILAGLTCGVGIVFYCLMGDVFALFLGFVLCMANFIMLFFGQRMAKDYAGAAGIVPYFIVILIGFYMLTYAKPWMY